MASFVLEEFVGNGVLGDQMDSLTADGWTDVPTLKMMSKDDMDTLQLSQLQRDALELRTYLHDRRLMAYADTLEDSGKNLSELLATSPTELTMEYKMRRGHVARFLDRGSTCGGVQMPSNLVLPARQITAAHRKKTIGALAAPFDSKPLTSDHSGRFEKAPGTPIARFSEANNSGAMSSPRSPSTNFSVRTSSDGAGRPSGFADPEPKAPFLLRPTSTVVVQSPSLDPSTPHSKGMFSAPEVEPRCCGLVQPRGLQSCEVTSLAVLEKIMVQKLAPAHRPGMHQFRGKAAMALQPPFKAPELWAEQPTLLLCLRRPGCVMCRAEAHQLYSRKPIFDAMGIQMVVCLNEHIDAEVKSFWPRYWGGMVVVDKQRDFFKALGQGKLAKEGFFSGFLFNAKARANYKRAIATGIEGNYGGEGTIKGGLYILRPRHGGVAYQFVERNFGDWAPLDEVLQVCSDVMQRR